MDCVTCRFEGNTKNFKLYYDSQHYVGEKRFDTVHDLVADGLITFYLEAKASNYIAALSSQSNYAESPYVAYSTQNAMRRPRSVGSRVDESRRGSRGRSSVTGTTSLRLPPADGASGVAGRVSHATNTDGPVRCADERSGVFRPYCRRASSRRSSSVARPLLDVFWDAAPGFPRLWDAAPSFPRFWDAAPGVPRFWDAAPSFPRFWDAAPSFPRFWDAAPSFPALRFHFRLALRLLSLIWLIMSSLSYNYRTSVHENTPLGTLVLG